MLGSLCEWGLERTETRPIALANLPLGGRLGESVRVTPFPTWPDASCKASTTMHTPIVSRSCGSFLRAAAPCALVVSLFFTGCAHTPFAKSGEAASAATSASPKRDKLILGDQQYKYVYVTGSNIPVRVPVDPTARPLPSSSEVTSMSSQQFGEVIRRGQTLPKHN